MEIIEVLIDGLKVKINKSKLYLINDYKWKKITNPVGQTYFKANKDILHRLITNCPKGYVVDHINGDTLDNTLGNLRICSHTQNLYNQKKT